jgi:tetratricopeptide (TPR) repeat protein
MPEDVFTPLTKGYDLFRDGKYEAAEYQFKEALKADRYNPFALNDLAALSERQGKLKEAMAFLTDAQTYAANYTDKLEQACFPGGLCSAAKPVKIVGPTSMIATVVADNMAKLKDKMAKTPMPPEPSTPPPMGAPKK